MRFLSACVTLSQWIRFNKIYENSLQCGRILEEETCVRTKIIPWNWDCIEFMQLKFSSNCISRTERWKILNFNHGSWKLSKCRNNKFKFCAEIDLKVHHLKFFWVISLGFKKITKRCKKFEKLEAGTRFLLILGFEPHFFLIFINLN